MAKNFTAKPVTATKDSDLLNAPPNYQFIFMHNPNGWELVEWAGEYEWLPILKRFQIRPGVNGVKQNRRGGADWAHAKSRFESNGWRFIMPEEVEGGYMVQYEGRGGPVYSDKWTEPRSLGQGRNARIRWEFDQEGYDDFRRGLKELIGEPDPTVIDLKTTIQERRAVRRVREVHIPAIKMQVEKETARLEAMKKTRPKRKRTRKKATPKKATPKPE